MHFIINTAVVSGILYIAYGSAFVKFGMSTDDKILRQFGSISWKDCMKECNSRTSCNSVTYRPSAKYCRLHESSATTATDGTFEDEGFVYSKAKWWSENVHQCGDNTCKPSHKCDTSGAEPRCVRSECDPMIQDANIEILGDERHIGAKLKLRCLAGFENNDGVSTTICQENGIWSPLNLACKPQFRVRLRDAFLNQGEYTKRVTPVPDLVFAPFSKSECVQKCNHETSYCVAVSYFAENMTCVLSDNYDGMIDNGQPSYINLTGWEIVQKVMPIFHSRRGSAVRYPLTFDQAKDACLSMNTTIASRADAEAAFNMGYNMCACAWVAEEYPILLMHISTSNCHFEQNTRKCSLWRTTWDVFCVNKDY